MLARLQNTPRTDGEWQAWGFDHQASHDLIRQAIAARTGSTLTPYVIYPIPLPQMRVFLAANQQLHVDMNGALRSYSSDLEDVDLRDPAQVRAWAWLHYEEHYTAEQSLGIAS